MSNVDSTQQPKTLEEALAEIDSLRSQLSGSDLKVFSQNRELRVENQKLKEEIRQLTEQCVSQTFKVRGLEKSEEKLSSRLSDKETRIGELENRIQDLEARVQELGGELEEFRSKEIHLSQELENTVRSNAEALEKLLAEHNQQAEVRGAEFAATLAEKEKAIQDLEHRVEQFKEEFLSQEIALEPVLEGGDESGAFEMLSRKMEDFLGFPGRALVEQVFRLSGVDPSSTNASELEETFEVLQDTASQLVRDKEQEQELANLLAGAWQELGMGGSAVAPPAKPTPPVEVKQEEVEVALEATPDSIEEAEPVAQEETAAEAESSAEAEPSAEEEEPVSDADPESEPVSESEPTPEPESAVPEEESVSQPAAAEATETEPVPEVPLPEPEPTVEEAAEETPAEDLVEEEISVEEETSAEVSSDGSVEKEAEAAEESEESESEAAGESEAAPEPAPVVEVGSEPETHAQESEAPAEAPSEQGKPDFELAATHLEEGRHADALPIFEQLYQQDPSELTYQVGRLACLTGLGRFQEALDVGRNLEGKELGDSQEVYQESMDAALLGVTSEAGSDLVKKEHLLELILRAKSEEDAALYLDEAEEISLRIPREGELALLQATHRVGQDDVTEYLIDALHSLSDRITTFALLKTNLERYPELQPLSEFLERLLDSSRAESLEAESTVRELLGQGDSVEELLDEVDPGEEAVVQVFLEHMLPRSEVECEIPSEEFEELLLDAEPAAFVGSLRQALRSVDYTVFFDEIEVLSYDGEEHFLLRSSPEPKPTLLFGAELDDVPPEELRFLVLRELFSMYRRHSQLKHISSGLDDEKRVELVRACIDIYSEFESKVPEGIYQDLEALKEAVGAEEAELRQKLESFLREVYIQTESDSFLELGDFLYDQQLNRKWLDPIADNFGAKQTGMVVASYAICRDQLGEEEFEELEESGFAWLYSEENLEKYTDLRLRLQRLWSAPLKALISEPEE